MRFSLNPLASDIIISVYAAVTLYLRFKFESEIYIGPLNSIFIGLALIAFIWALIKLKVLNPNWFGLFNKYKNLQS